MPLFLAPFGDVPPFKARGKRKCHAKALDANTRKANITPLPACGPCLYLYVYKCIYSYAWTTSRGKVLNLRHILKFVIGEIIFYL